jgi:hypothetical protein
MAVVGFKIIEHLWRNDVEISDCSREARLNINIPVCRSITNHHTGEVHFKSVTLKSGLLIVLIDLPSEVWNINSTVAFTRDEQLIWEILWEFSKPLLKSGKSVL